MEIKKYALPFVRSIVTCFGKYIDRSGRASRTEFWNFFIFILLVSIVTYIVGSLVPERLGPVGPMLQGLVFLATAIPLFSALVRRMHDIGAPEKRLLVLLVPVLQLVVLYWAARRGDEGENEYGACPDF